MFEQTNAAAEAATYADEERARKGFFTDTTLCIGCKACEVACKEWNQLPSDGYNFTAQSYDNTSELNGTTWRHVTFVEQVDTQPEHVVYDHAGRWLMESDVCKHCTHAACLDVCPTGSLIRTEFGTVIVQQDICNGCGYCVPACPFGVIDKRKFDGHAGKCTLCYDRLTDGQTPACAKACPTESIQYGDLAELQRNADARLEKVQREGNYRDASLYLRDADDGIGGAGAFFLLLDKPEVYGLPPDPVDTTRDLPKMWRAAAFAALTLVCITAIAGIGARR
ncbi:MAG: 4Fe-4S dicluster domain-containing protein [Candidatus Eremiobacteraeota bacterium]|nr:4Fe-4S dicluster domain-containing protein [Candidatus Eremiobacteraeota bacterium]